MKSLDQIGIENGTDKASVFTRTYAKPKNYLFHVEHFFEPLRYKPIKFLEVGVGGGESIRTWIEYFTEAQIYGVDFVKETNIFNTPGKPFKRYTFSHGDQTDRVGWKCFLANHGSDWDVIVEDGGHRNDQVIITFEEMWPHIKSRGLYCIEDLGVACSNDSVFLVHGFPNHLDWLKALTDKMHNGQGDVDFVYLANELAIIGKK